jgi:hypothetical protein
LEDIEQLRTDTTNLFVLNLPSELDDVLADSGFIMRRQTGSLPHTMTAFTKPVLIEQLKNRRQPVILTKTTKSDEILRSKNGASPSKIAFYW